jgi:hypothetical protein
MAQGTTNYPTSLDTARENPSNMDSSEAAILAMQAQMGVLTVYATDGAIPVASGRAVLTKGSAAAMTLAAPATTDNGKIITITAGSDFAHVITSTGNILDGTTGANNTVTLAAFKGSSVTLLAYGQKWLVLSNQVATIA